MIFIENEIDLVLPPQLLEQAALAALEGAGSPDGDLTIAIVSDEHIQGLNRDFLGHDSPTDVLSFPAGEADPETSRLYLGDVIISHARAAQQARERGHPVEAELQLLVVHGVLHLLGYDHAGVEEKQRMWAAQADVLEHLGVSPNIVHD
jgi:probable rRNA maturation factor